MTEPGNPYNKWNPAEFGPSVAYDAQAQWDRAQTQAQLAYASRDTVAAQASPATGSRGGASGVVAEVQEILDNVEPFTSFRDHIKNVAACKWKPRLVLAAVFGIIAMALTGGQAPLVRLALGIGFGALLPTLAALAVFTPVYFLLVAFIVVRRIVLIGVALAVVIALLYAANYFMSAH